MGRGSAPAIPMSQRQFMLLDRERRKRSISRQNHTRINILLRASQGESNKQIAREEGVVLNTVKSWRSRWNSAYKQLLAFEEGVSGQGVSDSELLQKMLELISDRPRSGKPAHIRMEQKQQIVALACEKPEDYGYVMTDWTHQILAEAAVQRGIVESISASYAGRLLKNKRASTP